MLTAKWDDGRRARQWVAFLLTFVVDYRKRRLHFLIEGQNRLYQMLGSKGFEDLGVPPRARRLPPEMKVSAWLGNDRQCQ